MRRDVVALCCCFLVGVMGAGAVGAEKHPFNVHDLVAMQRIADPQPSPDGKSVAFVVTTMDLEANKGRKDIWLAATDGSGERRPSSFANASTGWCR